jgi:dihydropteroate synthase
MRSTHHIHLPRVTLEVGRKTLLMGIINVTPDSFYPDSRSQSLEQAVSQAERFVREGADLLDVGGESTRPGSQPVTSEQEAARVVPVIEALSAAFTVPVSIDTYKAEVAQRGLEAGAQIVNDISGLKFDLRMAATVSRHRAGLVLSHIRGTPADMHRLPPAGDILDDVLSDLKNAMEQALFSGIRREQIILDPGIGFGKNAAENIRLLHRLEALGDFGLPVLVGVSRKAFIGSILGQEAPEERLIGTVAAVVCSVLKGAHIVRVHDVAAMRQAVAVADAVENGTLPAD